MRVIRPLRLLRSLWPVHRWKGSRIAAKAREAALRAGTKAREGASAQRRSSRRVRWHIRPLEADWATAREAIRANADGGRSPG